MTKIFPIALFQSSSSILERQGNDTGRPEKFSGRPVYRGLREPPRKDGRILFCLCYLFMLMTVSSMVSVVVMALLLDWKPRWVVIICTNSVDMSTLDCSRA